MHRKGLILLILLCFELLALSENVRYKFSYYGKNEGLLQSFITCIHQDDRGFIWIGTGEGLFQFDGVNFKRYSTDNHLSFNFVTSCVEDNEGRLWFGHTGGGVTINDHGKFKCIKTDNSMSISDMFVEEDNVWLATQGNGLMRVDKSFNIQEIPSPLPNRHIFSVYPIGYDRYLFGTNQGLFIAHFNKKTEYWSPPYAFEETEDHYIKKIIASSSDPNVLIILTQTLIYSFNLVTNRIKALDLPEDFVVNGTIPEVNSGIFDDKGRLWLTTFGNGVYQLYPNKSGGFNDFANYCSATGLQSETDNTKCIFQDREGNIWFGMSEKGLARIIDNNLSVFSYNDLLEKNSFSSLAAGSDNVWAGAFGTILNIDAESGKVMDRISFEQGLPEDMVTSLYIHGENELWIGTEGSGLFFLDLQSGFLYKKEISYSNIENSINYITGIDDEIWVATVGGLFKMDTKTSTETWYRSNDSYIYNNIEHLFIDSKRRIFISSKGKQVKYLDREMRLQSLNHKELSQWFNIYTIAEDENGNLWIGTNGSGLVKIQGDSVTSYNQSSGLLSDYCYSLFTHGQSVFVGHHGGISKLDIVNSDIDVIGENQGVLSGTNFIKNAVVEDALGNLWFGTSHGLIRIKNDKESIINSKPPQINILSVKINDEEVDYTKRIDLEHGEYKIEFNYIGIKHNNPLEVRYQYKLEGYDTEWSDYVDKGMVQYLKIGYGIYEFKLRAFNEHHHGTELSTPIKIWIKKPFYLKVWFYLLGLAVLVGSVYLIILYRERNLRRIQTNLMKKLNEKTREIIVKEEIIKERRSSEGELIKAKNKAEESNLLKSVLLANLSHEIRTPLNAIVGFSNLLNDIDLNREERENYAQVITKNSDNLLGLIEDIVDLSQIESNLIEPRITRCYIYNILNDVYLKNRDKAFEYCGDRVAFVLANLEGLKGKQIKADSSRLEQILDKLIDNALKFTAEGSVEIGYHESKGFVDVFVKDTGIGMSTEQMQYIFEAFRRVEGQKEVLYGGAGIGLTIADKLGTLMGMKLLVESELEKGATFILKIPVAL